jgi:G3E family GTPase
MQQSKIPVTILTGFLGSGKTTLINRILSENHGKRIAVIENEFGEIGIDHEIVMNAEEEIFEMNNGCICCTVRGDLIRILGNLGNKRDKFDYILIETTGLADPAPVAQTFFVDDEIKSIYQLDGIVSVVDSKHIWNHFDSDKECKEQIAFADVILLNKKDLVSDDEFKRVKSQIKMLNANVKLIDSIKCDVPISSVLDIGGFDLKKALQTKPTFLEPEYPFEWAGLYSLDEGQYRVTLKPGPDPSMNVLLLNMSNLETKEITAAEKSAIIAFSSDEYVSRDKSILRQNTLHELVIEKDDSTEFFLSLKEQSHITIFTQHHPDEFEMQFFNDSGQKMSFLDERVYNPEHEHSDEISSVGITVDGEVDAKKFQSWISILLQTKGADIFRSKGVLNISGFQERYIFQGVHMLMDGSFDRAWGKKNKINQIVFIGKHLDRKYLTEGFISCLKS